ncbi:MAG: response regulator [Planctomycetota bacterium]|jgi:chemotaxis response regulator CheB
MKKIGIILANRPQLMREVVREIINRQNDMEVVGEAFNSVDIVEAVKETEADAVILALNDPRYVGLGSYLLMEYPNLTILGLSPQGENVFLEQLSIRRLEIVDPSESKILDAVRRAVRETNSLERDLRRE